MLLPVVYVYFTNPILNPGFDENFRYMIKRATHRSIVIIVVGGLELDDWDEEGQEETEEDLKHMVTTECLWGVHLKQ